MTVRELIEELEQYPDLPVVVDGCEVTQIVIRQEIFYSSDSGYAEDTFIKLL